MLREIDQTTLGEIKNKAFRQYAQSSLDDYTQFMESIKQFGLPLRRGEGYRLRHKPGQAAGGIVSRNNGHSFYVNRLSPACVACRGEADCATHFISMRCGRSCYYCFNSTGEHYEYYLTHQRDYRREFELYREAGYAPSYIGLSGGEPLLHREDAVTFFRLAKELFGGVHTRLYTCGDQLDDAVLAELREAGLDEIRISVKLEDSAETRGEVLRKLGRAKDFIPAVMVEMPVIPGTLAEMEALLLALDALGIFGINLLEFCFPYTVRPEFQGFAIKDPPYQVPYNYGYGGGLPVAGSEEDCLRLLDFAVDRGLKLGVHYCSLENKFTGQVWAQNKGYASRFTETSKKDFFIKTAKVFGADSVKAAQRLGSGEYLKMEDYIMFRPALIPKLAGLGAEVAVSLNILEKDGTDEYLRELKLYYTTPEKFNLRAL